MASWFVEFSEWYAEQHPAVKALVVLGGGGDAVGVGIVAAPVVGAMVSAAGVGAAAGTLSGALGTGPVALWRVGLATLGAPIVFLGDDARTRVPARV